MPNKHWRQLLHEVSSRIRAMDPAVPPGAELAELGERLARLDESYEEERARIAADTKRRLADLEELHVANRMVTVGMLTAGMAHELGTPLGVVLARAQMIASDETDLDEARKDAVAIIAQVGRMTQMCREVLDFARPKAPTRDPVEVVQLLRQMIALLLPEARKRTTSLVVAGDPPPTMVLGNASKLMQILTNLAINAAHAMSAGGVVTLSVATRPVVPPAQEQLPEGDYVCIDVRDTGTGIRAADLPHIFETFFTTKQAGEGTGLGLAVSYRIAREHDGWIGVVTEEGRGTTFTVYLPPIADAHT